MISKTKKKIPPTTEIRVWNRQRRIRINSGAAEIFCGALAEFLNLYGSPFSVVFTGAAAMRKLNREWRKKDYATDVLSFSYDGEFIDGLPFLGEIVVAPEIAARRAAEYGATPEREIRKLIVHGALHLMGYDHETDGGEMIRMQNMLVRKRFFKEGPDLVIKDR